jgi:predicted GNAT family N-acyltransferase
MSYLTKILDSLADRKSFCCGNASLDHYIHEQVGQDIRRKLAVCFIVTDNENHIKGYYTLSNDSIPMDELPEEYKMKFPKSYIHLPVTLLGRLAVDQKYQGSGLGKLLLIDALKRSYEVSLKSIGSLAVVVSPLDAEVENFYQKYGFVKLPDSGKMFLSMKTIAQLFR